MGMETWNTTEESAFADLMVAGRLGRLAAIRLYRRARGNLARAIAIATAEAPTDEEVARRNAASRPSQPKTPTKIAGRAVLEEGNGILASI